MTKKSLRNEIIRCGRDPCYFIRKYVKIRHPVRGLIPFEMFDYQEGLVKNYIEHRFNVVLKARQLGISEVTAAFAAWFMLFHRDKNILVMATKAETAKNIVRKVQTAFKKLPRWLMLADMTTDNKMSVELSNGSVIKAVASSDDAGRSEALSLLIIDEAAFIKNMDELWTGLLPTVQAGGRVVVLSTPNGVGNTFHKIYSEAERFENEFHPTKLMWWLHPERIQNLQDDPYRTGFKTSDWYKHETKNMSHREVAQELECNFLASGETVLSGEQLEYLDSQTMEPISKENWDRNLFVWNTPHPGYRYFISADVARGDGKDHSAFHVWDGETMSQVAEYYGKVPPDEFAKVLCETGYRYNTAMLIIENNTIGLACLEHIKLAEYPSVYYSRKGDQKPGELIDTRIGALSPDLIPGFTVTSKTRPLMIAKFEEYVRTRTTRLHSRRLLHELRTFIWVNGRPEAMRGYNDDLVMSAAMGIWMRDTFLAPNFVNVEVQRKMLGAFSTMKTSNEDVVGASKAPHSTSRARQLTVGPHRSPYEISLPTGRRLGLGWLIDKG